MLSRVNFLLTQGVRLGECQVKFRLGLKSHNQGYVRVGKGKVRSQKFFELDIGIG